MVFAGPSITAAELAAAPVEVRPPVGRGDIDRLLAEPEPVAAIGIVDGVFLQGLMISPKEVLRAIDRGVAVFGSSSMGALRAAELDVFGMRGVGQVYRMYSSGEVDADDEVAITFDPETHRPLCEPMVNIRVALAAAVRHDVVPAAVAAAAVRIAKQLYFPDRTYPRVLHELAEHAPPEQVTALRDFLDRDAPDAKREDAVTLLEAMC